MGSLPVFGAILLAIAVLVWLAAKLGFAESHLALSDSELQALLDGLPRGFSSRKVVFSADGDAAIAIDDRKRIALVAQHGAHHIARLAGLPTRVINDSSHFVVRDGQLELSFDAKEDADFWRTHLGQVTGRP